LLRGRSAVALAGFAVAITDRAHRGCCSRHSPLQTRGAHKKALDYPRSFASLSASSMQIIQRRLQAQF
jgi:hypothetical protein